ncbi:hypothetical protein A2435_01985 [Candidatus Woesebacteria bacterium RIFOXYC1_FULL_46_16]|uniref:Glycosyl transferase family 1 n=3 Tax=Candidatus Woeseibacteriota TaxID=1752722 RepID=A0A1F8DA56_9BACT|nr:MAG: hypothetical protein A2435_01985 [Candidatus Woesebacteria bacterium RIFOXYC1_FULL_46_16]
MNKPTSLAVFSLHACPLASQEGKETGGLNVYVLETAKELAKLEYRIDMFTRSQDARQPYVVNVSPNVRVIHLVAGPEKPIPKRENLPLIDIFVKAFFDFAKKENLSYDLLHGHYYFSGLAGLKVRKKLEIPLIMTFHTLALMKNLVGRTTDEKEEEYRINAELELVQKADCLIATSDSDRAYLKYLYNTPEEKISVATPGVDTKLFSEIPQLEAKKEIGARAEHKIILAVGRIEPLKGFDSLLFALKILLVRNPQLKNQLCLWIVGGDTSEPPALWSKELKHLETLRRQLGITTSVKFVGREPQKRLPYYYSAASVVVMPSHYESFGLVALEAMACGRPVIASNVTGVSSLIGTKRGKLITSVNNPLLLADQIEDLITNRGKFTQVKEKLKKEAEKHTWTKTARKMDRVYKNFC